MLDKPLTCAGCPLYSGQWGKKTGFSLPDGSGESGVMVIAEALGKDEEQEGRGLVGASGHTLFQQLKRVGIEREGLTIFNTIACRPPDNKLVKQPYEQAAIVHCAPNLDAAIDGARAAARANGKTFVIVTLGQVAFKRVMGYDYKTHGGLLKKDYIGYPHWNAKYGAWVFAAQHPAYLLRGSTHLWPIVQFVFTRAIEVSRNGLVLDVPRFDQDPNDVQWTDFVKAYCLSLVDDPDNPLSYDIETNYKNRVSDEDEVGKGDEDGDHTITRIGFSFRISGVYRTASCKWSAEYMAGIEQLFERARFVLGWNSDHYDYPRVSKHVRIHGLSLDGMIAWHILNSSLDKRLGFVAPFYVQDTEMWKHLDESAPAYYNAKDAYIALKCWFGIKRDLIANNLWHVYERHWIRLSEALKYMSDTGVLIDEPMRKDAEERMSEILDSVESKMEAAVPKEARKWKIAKKQPKDILDQSAQWKEVWKEYPENFCPRCGISLKRKWKKHSTLCTDTAETPTAHTVILVPMLNWAKPMEFKVSKLGMTKYQAALKHQAVMNRKEKKVTFNEDAIVKLVKQYPRDPLYPLILEHRKVQKLLSTYVGITTQNGKLHGGMPVGKDGRIHTVYGRNANTLRFTSEDPNLQNLPRPKGPEDLASIIRNLIIGAKGNMLYARDFSGIEAVLTGYFALDQKYIRLAKQDVHTYYTVYAIYELEGPTGRVKSSDLPDIDWPDERLFPALAELKGRFKKDRNNLYKHLVHAANFGQGAGGARDKIFSETRVEYPTKLVQKVMDVYYSLFPKIKKWHSVVANEAEHDGFLRNPFDYVCRFSKVYDYRWEGGGYVSKPGPDWNRVIAYKPQSTAVGIITEAILRLYFERFEEAGQFLRLQVHDELFLEPPVERWQEVDRIVRTEMERPVPQLPCPPSWQMGEYLAINTEAKVDLSEVPRWGSMHSI
jgi:uracil-DNA glycosylase family 4